MIINVLCVICLYGIDGKMVNRSRGSPTVHLFSPLPGEVPNYVLLIFLGTYMLTSSLLYLIVWHSSRYLSRLHLEKPYSRNPAEEFYDIHSY